MLFLDEVKTVEELVEKLGTFNQEFDKVKACVVCFIFDKDNNLILNRRGPGARDDVGKLQAIGGSVNRSDADFRAAMERELREEAGDKASIEVGKFLGAFLNPAKDSSTGEIINWIILGYVGNLTSGELINMEPDRSIGFEKAKMEDFREEELSHSTSTFIKNMLKNK